MIRSTTRLLGRSLGALFLVVATGLTGCFQMEYVIELEEDFSGEVAFDIEVDLDRMAYAMAAGQKAFMGDGGSPTDEEVQEARDELLSQLDSGVLEEDNIENEIGTDLPPGVTLLHAEQTRDGLRTAMSIRLAFDHITSLEEMEMGGDATGDTQISGIQLIDEGDTFVLRDEPLNPVKEIEDNAGGMDGLDGLIQTTLNDLSFVFAIDAPFEIVEHNATERSGNRLTWIHDFESLSSGQPTSVFVRYRK